jgi:hypothetical protein
MVGGQTIAALLRDPLVLESPQPFGHLAGGLRRHKIPSMACQEPTKDRWTIREPRKL